MKQQQTALHTSLKLLQKKPYTLDQLAKKLGKCKNTAKRTIEKIQDIKWINLMCTSNKAYYIDM